MEIESTKITGLTLIEKVLEFVAMTSDSSEWSFDKLKHNPPRYVRLQQLKVLLKLFIPQASASIDIKWHIESVLNGNFILQNEIKQYDQLLNHMDNLIGLSKHPIEKIKEWTREDLKFNYQEIVKYKIKLNELLNMNNGIMEMSYSYLYSGILTNKISREITFKTLDNFLLLVIDPAQRTFTKEDLIRIYNYPKENIYYIDLEYS